MTQTDAYTLLEGKHMVPDDVIDLFVLIIIDSFKKVSNPYKRRATITHPLALLMSKVEHTAEGDLSLITNVIHHFVDVELILMTIILNGHFHLLMLDKGKKYINYSSTLSLTYNIDTVDMVSSSFLYNFSLFSATFI